MQKTLPEYIGIVCSGLGNEPKVRYLHTKPQYVAAVNSCKFQKDFHKHDKITEDDLEEDATHVEFYEFDTELIDQRAGSIDVISPDALKERDLQAMSVEV